jgi:FkbM family methyltransferase
VVEADTIVGPLLLPKGDTMITPRLVEDGVWDPLETDFLLGLLAPGQTFVDIGAHVGYYTVLAAQRVGPTGTVIAFEPEPRNRALLSANVAAHGFGNVEILPYAAHREPGSMSLELDEANRGGHHLVELGAAELVVECVRPDDVLPERVDVVKIDIQGYDHDAVAGLERTIAANPDLVIMTEISAEELAGRGVDPAAVLAGYEALGCELAVFDGTPEPRPMAAWAIAAALAGRPWPWDPNVVLRRARSPRPAAGGPTRTPWLSVSEEDDGLAVLSADGNRCHHLNPTAALVLALCDGERGPADLAAAVQSAYGLDEPPEGEVAACLSRLVAEGLVL